MLQNQETTFKATIFDSSKEKNHRIKQVYLDSGIERAVESLVTQRRHQTKCPHCKKRRISSNKDTMLLSRLLLFVAFISVGMTVPQINCTQYETSSEVNGLKVLPQSGAKVDTFGAGESDEDGKLSQHSSKIEKRASIVNLNGRSLESQAGLNNQADREEEATNTGGDPPLSGSASIEPQLTGARRQVTAGDMSTLGSEIHESGSNYNYNTNSNENADKNSFEPAKLRIVRILGPEATQNGTQNVTMDCMFKFDKKLDQRLTVKWFFNDEVEPIYQWIPELNKRVYSDKYEHFLDKSYEVSEDVDFMLQAYKWLQLAAGQSSGSGVPSADTPLLHSSPTSMVTGLESIANFDSTDQADRAQIETSRRILANRLNKLAKLGGQHSRQLLDSLRAALNMEHLDWSRYRALRLIKPTTELSGRFTCSVSSLDGDDLRSTKLLVYEPAKNFTFSVSRVSNQYYNLSCKADQVFPRPSLTLYRYRAGPLEPQAQPLRQYAHRPKLAATLLRQEPIPGTQTQLTVGLVRSQQQQQSSDSKQKLTANLNLPLTTISVGELSAELPNDISSPINDATGNANSWQQPTENYQPMVYEISSWALVDEVTLSSKVVSQFECLLSIEGTGYEQRQSLALQRGWHVNSAGIAMRSTLVGLFSALASLLCLMLALVEPIDIPNRTYNPPLQAMDGMDTLDEDSMEVDEITSTNTNVITANEALKYVKLRTSDNKCFSLSKSQASCSNALQRVIDVRPNTISSSNEYINLQNVSSSMLTKVIEWCQIYQRHTNEKSELESTDGYKEFFTSMPEQNLFNLMHVSNYLDVESLFNACCRTIAKQWEGKKVEEIRKMYNIKCDFEPDEERQMLMESKKLGMDN